MKVTLVGNNEIVSGNYGYDLEFALQDKDDNPVDLTGATSVLFLAKKIDDVYSIGGACTIVEASEGTCRYPVKETDFPTSGQYIGEITASWEGKELTFRGYKFLVHTKQVIAP